MENDKMPEKAEPILGKKGGEAIAAIAVIVLAIYLFTQVSDYMDKDHTAANGGNNALGAFSGPASPSKAPPDQPIQLDHGLQVTFQPALQVQTFGSPYMEEKAAEGGVLVVLRYTIKNVSATPVGAEHNPEVKLIDPAGVVYSPDAGKSGMWAMEHDLDQKFMSDLNPGITVRNAEIFEVSKDAFNAETWSAVVGPDDQRVSLVAVNP